ncbi:FAD-dependent oxidoreductase [Brevibacterium samyangense]|uniref:Glycine oxidase ThiO n=1 Tax=Brevibacterium samyangense TaxID=366888 RepID=A0ABN2TJW1_9MICO
MHVVVIGAGIVGLLTALEVHARGHSVEVRTAGIAEGATFAAAGMLAPTSEIQVGQGPLWAIMQEAAAAHRDLASRLPSLSAGLPSSATAESAGYRADATLVVARDRADLAALQDLAVLQRTTGAEVTELLPRRIRALEPSLARNIAGGVRIARDHQVDPRRLAATALRILRGHGVPVVTGAVRSLDGIAADRIVVAAGLGAARIDGPHRDLDLALRPAHGDILRLHVPRSLLLPGEDHLLGGTVRALVSGRPVYLVPRTDGGLVLGASSREDPLAGTSTGAVLQLLQDAAQILPSIRETELREVTTRARPGTPDDLPLLGPVPGHPHVVVSTGYHRHGILLSAWAARRAADIVDGHPSALPAAVDPARFTQTQPHPQPSEENSCR